MSLKVSRRAFLLVSAASTASAIASAPPLSAFNLSRAESNNICALFADDTLSVRLQKQLVGFREIERHDLIQRERINQIAILRNWLRNNQGKRVVGAVGCDFYPVLESLVREVGGSLLLHGRHVVSSNDRSSHSFYTVPTSQGAAHHFMSRVAASNSQFQVSEYCIGAVNKMTATPQPPLMNDWLEAVANMLVDLASGRWQVGSVVQYPATHLFESASPVSSVETFAFSL